MAAELNDKNEPETVEADIMPSALEVRAHDAPVTLSDLAGQREGGLAILRAKHTILTTLRVASLQLTNPQDWVLFRDRDGNVTGYLQDRGCDRVAPLWGIDVDKEISFERIQSEQDFAWVARGSGSCRITGQAVHAMEGTRYSTEDFVKGLQPIQKEVRVKQAARANLDGSIVRELCGLKSVPEQELADAWKGSWKKTSLCAKGKGFGGRQEREGARQTQEEKPNVPAPMCDSCQSSLEYRPAGKSQEGKPYDAYWRCPQYRYDSQKRESNGHSRIGAADWQQILSGRAAQPADGGDPGQAA